MIDGFKRVNESERFDPLPLWRMRTVKRVLPGTKSYCKAMKVLEVI
jgi:hypothetical protein